MNIKINDKTLGDITLSEASKAMLCLPIHLLRGTTYVLNRTAHGLERITEPLAPRTRHPQPGKVVVNPANYTKEPSLAQMKIP